jgi:processive 1,2-diacylglycerol beta-glucosyltransferase
MTHHVVISKAGGATTQESVNALCPMVVNQIIPGQEEGNYELLRRHQAGAFAATPAELVNTLQHALQGDAAGWRAWRRNLGGIARPSAARDIAAHVLAGVPRLQAATA